MNIAPFTKLDGSGKKVHFRKPTILDGRNYAGMPVQFEQSVVTSFLSDVQVPEKNKGGKVNSPLEWTENDRMWALFYLFVSSSDDTLIMQEYECQHCGETHKRQYDLTELSNTITENNAGSEIAIDLPVIKLGSIVPLYGYALEHIEELKNQRDQFAEDSEQWAVANYDMRLYEVAYRLRFEDDDQELSHKEQAKARYEYLLTLNPDSEYQQLAIKVRQAQQAMHHGLPTVYQDGQLFVVTRKHQCPNKRGKSSNLLYPFRTNNYLPNLR